MAAIQNAFGRHVAAFAPSLHNLLQLVPDIVGGKLRNLPLASDE